MTKTAKKALFLLVSLISLCSCADQDGPRPANLNRPQRVTDPYPNATQSAIETLKAKPFPHDFIRLIDIKGAPGMRDKVIKLNISDAVVKRFSQTQLLNASELFRLETHGGFAGEIAGDGDFKLDLNPNGEPNFDSADREDLLLFPLDTNEALPPVNPEWVKACVDFLKIHGSTFSRAEKTYDVDLHTLVALMFVETRLGKVTGDFGLLQVYFNLLQAMHSDILNLIETDVQARLGKEKFTQEVRDNIRTRAQRKTNLALEQFEALLSMWKNQKADIKNLKGSYGGAFGLVQFLPSSYLQYAVSLTGKHAPNLFSVEDAVLSAANYLKENGWRKDSPKSQYDALYAYNHSDDYVLKIQRLAEAVKTALAH